MYERLEQEEQRLKKHDGRWMDIQQSLLERQLFFRKASNLWKIAYIPSFVSITAHIVATVKKLYEILHILVRSELFLSPKFRLTFELIFKINIYQYKLQQILHT